MPEANDMRADAQGPAASIRQILRLSLHRSGHAQTVGRRHAGVHNDLAGTPLDRPERGTKIRRPLLSQKGILTGNIINSSGDSAQTLLPCQAGQHPANGRKSG